MPASFLGRHAEACLTPRIAMLHELLWLRLMGKDRLLAPGPINADLFLHAKMHHRMEERVAEDEMTMQKSVRRRLG